MLKFYKLTSIGLLGLLSSVPSILCADDNEGPETPRAAHVIEIRGLDDDAENVNNNNFIKAEEGYEKTRKIILDDIAREQEFLRPKNLEDLRIDSLQYHIKELCRTLLGRGCGEAFWISFPKSSCSNTNMSFYKNALNYHVKLPMDLSAYNAVKRIFNLVPNITNRLSEISLHEFNSRRYPRYSKKATVGEIATFSSLLVAVQTSLENDESLENNDEEKAWKILWLAHLAPVEEREAIKAYGRAMEQKEIAASAQRARGNPEEVQKHAAQQAAKVEAERIAEEEQQKAIEEIAQRERDNRAALAARTTHEDWLRDQGVSSEDIEQRALETEQTYKADTRQAARERQVQAERLAKEQAVEEKRARAIAEEREKQQAEATAKAQAEELAKEQAVEEKRARAIAEEREKQQAEATAKAQAERLAKEGVRATAQSANASKPKVLPQVRETRTQRLRNAAIAARASKADRAAKVKPVGDANKKAS
ncbi:MAG: hypothetical protein K0R76_885 [Alphaproteobacteria bacterium]|jgi:hypothetical protein|nr:hypothetical protein [Alphaproteobacteria bacterium]MDF3033931.1 hypothetical protein [Alphaproteobacteria bacterium]